MGKSMCPDQAAEEPYGTVQRKGEREHHRNLWMRPPEICSGPLEGGGGNSKFSSGSEMRRESLGAHWQPETVDGVDCHEIPNEPKVTMSERATVW
jgi:hypothetical protein